ncbi:MAG: hypothetical protein WCD04_14475 [Terriglobia bacterium]|jgi:hypothetical protein
MSEQTKSQSSEAHRIRSRRSIVAEVELHKTIKKVDTGEAIAERRFREAEERVRRLTKMVILEGEETMRPQLEDAMRDVSIQRDLIKACQAQRASTEAEIEKLNPSPVEGTTRQHQQERFREIVEKRLATDRQADQLLKDLREVLQERCRLTVEMADPSAALELTIPDDGLDTKRFEKLLDSLPADLLDQSEKWCAHFLREQKDAKPYVVRVENLLVGETLFDNGLWHFGDTIFLTDEEARDLLCDDYYAVTHEAPWRCQSPRVMTVEAYEAAAKTAREKGLSIQEVCFWVDAERDAQNQRWFKNNSSRKTVHKRAVSAEDNTPFENTIKVRVKYKGEIIEMANDQGPLDFVARGSGGPL